MSAAEAKAELRASIQTWRRAVTREEVRRWSEALCAHLRGWPLLLAGRDVLLFDPLAKEPQVSALAGVLRARGVRLFVPRTRGEGLDVVPRCPEEARDAGMVGVPPALSAALVPGLAFDLRGGRLGRGGGHYDRLLAQLPPQCVRVGVCFDGQVVARVPRQVWDQPVDAVVTEAGVRMEVSGRGRPGGQR